MQMQIDIFWFFSIRANETSEQYEKRLEDERERYSNLSEEQKAKKLQNATENREKESEHVRQKRKAADACTKANNRLLNPQNEKDAYQKWKQRYKK